MDKDHEGKKKKHHNSYFINKMVGEGLYEYVFAILARNRFTKGVVEKALNIIILLCRYCKPL